MSKRRTSLRLRSASALQLMLDHERDHPSRWVAVVSISGKVGCSAYTLHEWVKKAQVSSGERAFVPTEVADKVKALGCRRGTMPLRPRRASIRL